MTEAIETITPNIPRPILLEPSFPSRMLVLFQHWHHMEFSRQVVISCYAGLVFGTVTAGAGVPAAALSQKFLNFG